MFENMIRCHSLDIAFSGLPVASSVASQWPPQWSPSGLPFFSMVLLIALTNKKYVLCVFISLFYNTSQNHCKIREATGRPLRRPLGGHWMPCLERGNESCFQTLRPLFKTKTLFDQVKTQLQLVMASFHSWARVILCRLAGQNLTSARGRHHMAWWALEIVLKRVSASPTVVKT